jgi:hypothetical protein
MELTLNLFWLLLSIPAIWIWLADRRRAQTDRNPLRCLLVLGSVLVLLFPVVSATDDLRAMRPEMEESGTQDGSGNPHHGRLAASLESICQGLALVAPQFHLAPVSTFWAFVVQAPILRAIAGVSITISGRAPPSPFFQ